MNPNSPLILGFMDNLMFSTRVDSVVESLGYQMHWMEQWHQDAALDGEIPTLQRISQLAPKLILLDLGMAGIPGIEVIRQLKANSATGQIPVLCFGSHMNAEELKAARQAGADAVVARSRFFSDLPALIQKHISNEEQNPSLIG